jgi:hypothetical protein
VNQLKVKFAEPSQAEELKQWLRDTKGNLFDEAILGYPTLQTICAYNGQSVAYLPMQRALFLESLAVSPQATDLEKAQAFRDLVKASELVASSHGIKEIYMICGENIKELATKHGFEDVPWPVVRMKL